MVFRHHYGGPSRIRFERLAPTKDCPVLRTGLGELVMLQVRPLVKGLELYGRTASSLIRSVFGPSVTEKRCQLMHSDGERCIGFRADGHVQTSGNRTSHVRELVVAWFVPGRFDTEEVRGSNPRTPTNFYAHFWLNLIEILKRLKT